jgi:hypothetical protein
MPKQKRDAHLYELAKRGAEVRFLELVQEVKYLLDLFPHVRDSVDRDELPLSFIMARDAGRAKKQRKRSRRRRMSAAARKAVSIRMKKYWSAKRNAAKG